jgi:nucleoside-diphosphate-sugar epimerase
VYDRRVGVLGATSLVGACLLPLLDAADWQVVAFTRRAGSGAIAAGRSVEWRSVDAASRVEALIDTATESPIACWVSLAPIWVLPDYFALLKHFGVKRLVALSSTSLFTKESSTDPMERAVARRLADGEARLAEWAQESGIEATILRSTLIYGLGRDKNISAIARFIRRFGFFPLLSAAQGLRQPVHAADVAAACLAALQRSRIGQGAYNLSGGETLTYRDMVARVFAALHKPVRLVRVPAWVFCLSVAALRSLPRFAHWSPEMAGRMNIDLVFSHSEAARDLSFAPRGFALTPEDLPAR